MMNRNKPQFRADRVNLLLHLASLKAIRWALILFSLALPGPSIAHAEVIALRCPPGASAEFYFEIDTDAKKVYADAAKPPRTVSAVVSDQSVMFDSPYHSDALIVRIDRLSNEMATAKSREGPWSPITNCERLTKLL
jgi:hypothetical protein